MTEDSTIGNQQQWRIDLRSEIIAPVLDLLLKDKSTKQNIIWATNSYEELGEGFMPTDEITKQKILSHDIIQPRVSKSIAFQDERTKSKGEVFTPTWICSQMNNRCDEAWFGHDNVFTTQNEKSWEPTTSPIDFGELKWKDYVDSRRIEITCGEAPFLVSRYDATSGEFIDIERRIGLLDRKLRIVGENAKDEEEWMAWTTRAFQSVYGYEYQGDNLLVARINLLLTFTDYLDAKWHRPASKNELQSIANIICWNIWQMDGLKDCVPLQEPHQEGLQLSLFETTPAPKKDYDCKIFDWRANESIKFKQLKTKKS